MDRYILGLLASDGFTQCHICKDGSKSYHSNLEMSEEQIIQDICKIYNKPIHYRKRTIADKEREFWSVNFSNKEVGYYGKYLVKGRPHIKELYDSFNEQDKIEFMRGVFDGDGSIIFKSLNNNSNKRHYRKTIGFSVNASQADMKLIIEDFAKTHNLILSTYLDKRSNNTWYLSFNSKYSLEYIYHLFYDKKPNLKNTRKYNKFHEFYTIYCTDENERLECS